jgi:hypothetical protein
MDCRVKPGNDTVDAVIATSTCDEDSMGVDSDRF